MQQDYNMLFRMNERKEIWHLFLIKTLHYMYHTILC